MDKQRSLQVIPVSYFQRQFLVAALGLIASLLSGPSRAEEMTPRAQDPRHVNVVLELFTSQGCSSCPPADALLKKYADMKGVMALSLPVDYWDYLGWKDTYASPKNTERQRAYARTFETGPGYTPQIVVNGMAQMVGSNRTEIDAAINREHQQRAAYRVPVTFWRNEKLYVIEVGNGAIGPVTKQATVWLGLIQKSAQVPVKRGENGGRTLTYTNVVRDLVPVGVWEGTQKTLHVTSAGISHPDSDDQVVLVQDDGSGAIIGAAFVAN